MATVVWLLIRVALGHRQRSCITYSSVLRILSSLITPPLVLLRMLKLKKHCIVVSVMYFTGYRLYRRHVVGEDLRGSYQLQDDSVLMNVRHWLLSIEFI